MIPPQTSCYASDGRKTRKPVKCQPISCKINIQCESTAALLAAVFPEVPRHKHMKAVREDGAAESLRGIYYSCRKSQKLENRGVSPAVTDSNRSQDVTTDYEGK